MREAEGVLIAELSIRDNEANAVRETLTKQDGEVARTRRGWQQATETVSEMRRTLADADIASNGLRAEIAEREGRIGLLKRRSRPSGPPSWPPSRHWRICGPFPAASRAKSNG